MKSVKKILRVLKHIFLRTGVAVKYVLMTAGKSVKIAWQRHHFLVPPAMWPKYAKKLRDRTISKFKYDLHSPHFNPFNKEEYNRWLKMHPEKTKLKKLPYQPLISVVIPVYNINPVLLRECLDSVLAQSYNNFEICIADDCSNKQETLSVLKEYEQKDTRIKIVYRKQNGHIAEATNSALKIAKGEFVAFMDNDDTLAINALYEVAVALNQNKGIDMLYSDEDKIDADGKFCDPHFKPDFSPDTLMGVNYICHLTVMRKKILDKIGGLNNKYIGAQDYDLILRFVEQTQKIYHIPKILYHWRKIPGSTAATIDSKSYAITNGRKAVEAALKRRGLKGKVLEVSNSSLHVVEYAIPNNSPLVSIIIPTKNGADVLKKCIDSIYDKTSYKNYEIIIVDNQSDEKDTLELLSQYKKNNKNFKVVLADFEFNYSRINNLAVKKSRGEYIVLLNNDTKILSENWLTTMLGYAIQKHVGAVGPKLLYPDMTIQHGGIIMGLGGVAGHAYIGSERYAEGYYGRLVVPYDYGGVTAACLMIKKSKFNKVNGLEEKLRVAFNDVDLNMKLLEAGYYNVFVPQIELIHYESKTRGLEDTPEKFKRFMREYKFMKEKWGNKLTDGRFYNPNYSFSRDFYLDAIKCRD